MALAIDAMIPKTASRMERMGWWMGGLVVTMCAGAACGDDVQSADAEESSTGMDSPTTSTSTTSSSGDPDDSGSSSSSSSSSSSDTSSSSSEGSTGEEMPMPTDARSVRSGRLARKDGRI